MNPLLSVAFALLPDLVRLIAGDKVGTFSQKVSDAVKTATATDDQNTAQTKVDSDPAVRAELQKLLADMALEETKEQNRAEEARRDSELETLKEQFAESMREREDALNRFREEMRSTQDARSFYSDLAKSGAIFAWVNPALSLIITLGFMTLVFVLLFRPPAEAANNQIFNIALGALATAFATVIGFHFGSSVGSKEKDGVNRAILTEQVARREEDRVATATGSGLSPAGPHVDSPSGPTGTGLPGTGSAGTGSGGAAGTGSAGTGSLSGGTTGPGAAAAGAAAAAGSNNLFDGKAPAVMRQLMQDFGLTDFQAGGLLGNIGHECNGFKTFQEIGIRPPKGGWGWCQWTGPRRRQFEAWAKDQGLDFKSDEANYGFLAQELKTTETAALRHLKNTGSLEDATRSVMDKFERPGAPHLDSRVTWARRAMRAFAGV